MKRVLDLDGVAHVAGERTLLMGILNVTPDSFSDGGRYNGLEAAVTHALEMEAEGADFIDIGAESTRPGHVAVSAEEEWARLEPVLTRLSGRLRVPISVDTYKAATAERALGLGVTIINDIWGLQRDAGMAAVVARHGAGLVAMHNRAAVDPAIDIVADMLAFFERTLAIADEAGIARSRIVLDPGVGFGKTPDQNVRAIAELAELRAFGLPILVGASRKSLIGHLSGAPVGERLPGTIAAHVLSVAGGADILRVHDVREHLQAVRLADAIVRRGGRGGSHG